MINDYSHIADIDTYPWK